MQDQDFKIYSGLIFLHQNEQKEKWENGLLKPLFVQVAGKAHLEAMSSTRGNIVFSLLEKERNISYNKTRGHFGLRKTVWSFQEMTPNVFISETSNEWSSQIIWRDRKSLASKWLMMGTTKAELCKQIWK